MILTILAVLAWNGLYWYQILKLWKNVGASYAQRILHAQEEPLRHWAYSERTADQFFFRFESPFHAWVELLFRKDGELHSVAAGVRTYQPGWMEPLRVEPERAAFPIAELKQHAEAQLGAGVVLEEMVFRRPTIIRLRGRAGSGPFEADYVRENYRWVLRSWRRI